MTGEAHLWKNKYDDMVVERQYYKHLLDEQLDNISKLLEQNQSLKKQLKAIENGRT